MLLCRGSSATIAQDQQGLGGRSVGQWKDVAAEVPSSCGTHGFANRLSVAELAQGSRGQLTSRFADSPRILD